MNRCLFILVICVCFSCHKWVSVIVWVIAGAGVREDWLEGEWGEKPLPWLCTGSANKDTRTWCERTCVFSPPCLSLLAIRIYLAAFPLMAFQVPATHRLWFRGVGPRRLQYVEGRMSCVTESVLPFPLHFFVVYCFNLAFRFLFLSLSLSADCARQQLTEHYACWLLIFRSSMKSR